MDGKRGDSWGMVGKGIEMGIKHNCWEPACEPMGWGSLKNFAATGSTSEGQGFERGRWFFQGHYWWE